MPDMECRIKIFPVVDYFKMQMITGCSTSSTNVANMIAAFDCVADGNHILVHMRVQSFPSIQLADDDCFSVAIFDAYKNDFSIVVSDDLAVFWAGNVYTLVHPRCFAGNSPIAKTGTDAARAQSLPFFIGKLRFDV